MRTLRRLQQVPRMPVEACAAARRICPLPACRAAEQPRMLLLPAARVAALVAARRVCLPEVCCAAARAQREACCAAASAQPEV
mmetsp:Transcript_8616/g.20161  ORF Transcript_8616/g.20161 Transcript_8616/m.20161 type:complete len:83 (+) Transcript_8616:630-878(+)